MNSSKILIGIVGGILFAGAVAHAAGPLDYRKAGPAERAAKLISLLSAEDSTKRRQGAARLSDEIASLTSVMGENPGSVPFLTTAGEAMIPLLQDERATVKVRVERLLEQLVDGLAETASRGSPIAKDRAFTVLATLSPKLTAVEGNETAAAVASRAARILKSAERTPKPIEKPAVAEAPPVAPPQSASPAVAIPAAKSVLIPPPIPQAAKLSAPETMSPPGSPPKAVAESPKREPDRAEPPAAPTPSVGARPETAPASSPTRSAHSGKPSAQDLIVLRMLDEKLRRTGEREQLAALELAEKVYETILIGSASDDTYMSRLSLGITDNIRALLTSPSASLRQTAARITGLLQDLKAVDPLIGLLGDADGSIRKEAALSLRAITGKDFGLDVDRWKSWSVGSG